MKKKIKTHLDVWKTIRKTWEMNPVERVKKNNKKKNRAKQKNEFKKFLKEEL